MQNSDPVPSGEAVRQRPGSIGRVVVDDDEFAVDASGSVGREYRVDEVRQSLALIVGRDDNRDGGWARRGAQGSNSQAL